MVANCDRKSFGSRWKNSKSCSDNWHQWCFWSAFRHFWTHFKESFRMSKYSQMMDPTRSRKMPSCSAIDLAKIRLSSKISSWIWSLISGVVTVLGCPGWGASQVEKSPRSPNVSDRMAWISFSVVGGEKNLMTDRISMLLKSRTSPDMLPFRLCNK